MVTRSTTYARVGDVLAVPARRVGDSERLGEIVEILGEEGHEHFRVRWEDDHESLVYPGGDTTVRHRVREEGEMLTVDVKKELDRRQIEYQTIPHTRTMTAAAEAAAVGVPPADVAKTVVLVAGTGYVRATLSASDRLDLHKVRTVAGDGAEVRLATESELASAYPMFELGAVPPFGGPAGDRVIVDKRLARRDSIVLEVGNHEESVRLAISDLLALTGAEVADLTH